MKIRLERDVLAEAVQWAARSLPVRPSVPILAGLLVRADAAGVTFSSFDYETSAQITVKATVTDEGQALISGRLLADISRSLPAKPVDITADDTRMELVCGSARFTLQTLPVADYPSLPAMPEATGTVPSAAFAQAVSQVVVAAGRDELLPVFTGVRVEIEGDIDLAAGHRPLPDGAQGTDLEPRVHPDLGDRAGAGQGAERHVPLDDRRRGGHPEPGRPAARATASSASRVTVRRGSGRPRLAISARPRRFCCGGPTTSSTSVCRCRGHSPTTTAGTSGSRPAAHFPIQHWPARLPRWAWSEFYSRSTGPSCPIVPAANGWMRRQ